MNQLPQNPSAKQIVDKVNQLALLRGSSWSNGSSLPVGGVDGDYYLRVTTGVVYENKNGVWESIMTISGDGGGGGGGGGLPVQATDLVVPVTTDAEFVTALADYWNYQFTESAKYIIQFQTGYVINVQTALTGQFMPHLVIRSQTTTDVDCTGFAANALGIKTPFLFVNCHLSAFYGTFTSANGSTCAPLVAMGTTVDFWNGNLLAPVALNMSGFTKTGASGGFQLYDWKQTSPYIIGTTVTLDVHAVLQYTTLRGTKFKIGNGDTQISGCSGSVAIETTAGTDGRILHAHSVVTVFLTHSTTATFSFSTSLAGAMHMTIAGTDFTPYTGAEEVFTVGGGTAMHVYHLNTFDWHPQAVGNLFAHVNQGASYHAYGGTANINTTVATPQRFMRLGYGSTIQHNFQDGSYGIFPDGPYTVDGTTAVIENEVGDRGYLILTQRLGSTANLLYPVVPTEAGTSTPEYNAVKALVFSPASALTATTIDLTNYAKNGVSFKVVFDSSTIAGITWAGGTFVGAPASSAVGDVYDVIYRSTNSTFYFS